MVLRISLTNTCARHYGGIFKILKDTKESLKRWEETQFNHRKTHYVKRSEKSNALPYLSHFLNDFDR